MPPQPDPGPEDLQTALSSVARAIADSLELKEVWDRVADACRTVVPFEGMGVSTVQPDGRVRVVAVTDVPAAKHLVELDFSRADYSPRYWPEKDDFLVLVHDSRIELDSAYAVDRDVVERGFLSILRIPLGRGRGRTGSLVLTANEPNRFTEDHGRSLAPVAELVSLALAHEKLASRWRERRKRRAALERLIPTLTGTLDVRSVFEQISRIAQEIVPHDYFALALLSPDRSSAHMHAKFGGNRGELPDYPIPEEERAFLDWDYYIARDHTLMGGNRVRAHLVQKDPSRPTVFDREFEDVWLYLFKEMGIRSTLRAPVRLNGVLVAAIDFSSRKPDLYGEEEAEFAVRVAEHLALALAHQSLAEEERRTAAARDRAAQLEERVQVLAQELETLSPHRALGRSQKWKDVLAHATKVARTDTTVLMTGESGTGKEVVARFIHRGSTRKDGPFVALNCAALPEHLLESELFGHEKGAFTGALTTRPGKIEQAAGGVLFLDEVAEMSPSVQAKFLRVLQEREFQRLGGMRTIKADVRVLAATNRNLKRAISQGAFREDLYYRLAVFDIALPALRERIEDIELLVEAFLEEIGRTIGRPAAGVSEDARTKLVAYSWPGNVRELRNAIERAVILCEGGLITSEHLPLGIVGPHEPAEFFHATGPAGAVAAGAAGASAGAAGAAGATGASAVPPAPGSASAAAAAPGVPGVDTLVSAEREMILRALARSGENKSKAARLLGLTRAQLRWRLEKHGLITKP